VNAQVRPFAALQDRPYERAGSARNRSAAEGEGCAISGLPGRGEVDRGAQSVQVHKGTQSVPGAPSAQSFGLFPLLQDQGLYGHPYNCVA